MRNGSNKAGLGTRKVLFKLLLPKFWLPGMDSNHDSRLQRPLSYH